MKIFIKAKPGAREAYIRKIDGCNFEVAVKEPPRKGKANQAVVKALAEYFRVPVSNVKILAGFKSKQKIIEVK